MAEVWHLAKQRFDQVNGHMDETFMIILIQTFIEGWPISKIYPNQITSTLKLSHSSIEYEIIGEGSQISTNQKRESTVSWLLIG